MSRYFCLCPGGLKSDKDADVMVESFCEIQQIINNFGDAIPRKFNNLKTQHILDESPVKFPYWGKTYMVVAIEPDGGRLPLGYCNFEKKWYNSFSLYSILLYFLLALSVCMAIRSLCLGQFTVALWACTSFSLICCLLMQRNILTKHKTTYLLK